MLMRKTIFRQGKLFCALRLQPLLLLLAICTLLLFLPSLLLANNIPTKTIKIGVLAKRGHEQALKKWQPTAEYLSEKIPDRQFKIVPLDFEAVHLAAMSRSIDFLITNSSYYVTLELDHGLSRIATLTNMHGNAPQHLFGGVIFTRADRTDINTLSDVVGKSFSAVDRDSLGGWLAAWREFHGYSIKPDQDFGLLNFLGTHDAVVMAVLNGETEAGTVRTDTLERMAAEGKIVLADFKVLNRQSQGGGFNYLLSTRLYPEWPFAVLSHVPSGLVKDVTTALLSMPQSSPAAKDANIGGWDEPRNYQSIHELLKERHLWLYEKHIGKITLTDFIRKYWQGAALLVVSCCLLVLIAMYKTFMNKQLEQRVKEKTSDLRQEIEERKQTEQKLSEASTIINRSPVVAFLWRNEDNWPVEFVSDNVCELTGYPAQDFVEERVVFTRIIHADDSKKVAQEVVSNSQKEGLLSFEHEPYRIITKDGDIKWVDDRTYIRRDHSGIITHYEGIVYDITKRKVAEQENSVLESHLQQAQKMEAIGTIAGGIAHDFNNLLAIITGNLEIIQRKQKTGKHIEKNIEHIKNATARAVDLVKQILTFSRQEKQKLTQVDLSLAVNGALKLLRSIIPTTVEIISQIGKSIILINADSIQLQQVIINLCTNAVDAMEEKGLLKIHLEEADLVNQEIIAETVQHPVRYAKLSISDTGTGMNDKTIEKIFDPFFTTKLVGKGTGMGLSMVHGIVKQHGGHITVDSELGRGTTFNIYLPTIQEAAREYKTKIAQPLSTGTERILFVDDEESIVITYKQLLEDQGYKVTGVTSSTEALDIFKARPQEFDLVLTDQTMPNMSGTELTDELLLIRPNIPIILCSGFSSKISKKEAKRRGIRGFYTKPIGVEQLATAVRKALDEDDLLA